MKANLNIDTAHPPYCWFTVYRPNIPS